MALAWVFILLFAVACTSHPKGPPGKDVLKSDRFVELLVDIHYVDGLYDGTFGIINYMDNSERDTLDYYQKVFDKHDVDRDVFRRTIEYYSYNPGQFEAIYDRVVFKLNKMENELEMQPETAESDTLVYR